MKSYPLRTSIKSENELKTCCNLGSIIKPVSHFHGERGRGKTPAAIFGVVSSPERDPEEPRVPPVLELELSDTGIMKLYDYGFCFAYP